MSADPAGTARVMTYNIRAALGTDGVRSLERIAEVIAGARADVVALQEVDLVRERSGRVDQAAALAELTGTHHVSARSIDDEGGGYGNAILSRAPLELVAHVPLPCDARSEPRSVMWARTELGGARAEVLNTHLSFRRVDRPRQIEALLGRDLLGHRGLSSHNASPVVLCGDLNCGERGLRPLLGALRDGARAGGAARSTWPTRRPFRRIDYVLVSRDVRVTGADVLRSGRTRRASDHYPLVVDLGL
jgi:endonuclease/exonuclease/phosphatase family metal-dependent hydrolase